jgi:hypothetical protein
MIPRFTYLKPHVNMLFATTKKPNKNVRDARRIPHSKIEFCSS